MTKRIKGVAKAVKCVEECSSTSDLASCFIDCYHGDRLGIADKWVKKLITISAIVAKQYGFTAILYSREFKSFLQNPHRHLEKKLFIYTHDFKRGKLGLEDYAAKAMMATNTSLQTNLRTLYQNWCFLAILYNIYREGTRIVFPEHRVLSLERSGKQKLRWIPPNLVVDIPGYGSLSFYIEAPRPLAWGDSKDLMDIWSYYTALRPDLMVYGGRVYDIVDQENSPPIKKPDIIIEFKELPDWFKRQRDVKGPLARPLSAEEWRNRWIEGLWDGLADVLGVTRSEAMERVRERRGIRLNEVRVVQLYRTVYNPKKMYLVSKYPVPEEIREMLEAYDIEVVDGIGFNMDKLKPLAEKILRYAVPAEEYVIRVKDPRLYEILLMVKELWEKGVLDKEEIYTKYKLLDKVSVSEKYKSNTKE